MKNIKKITIGILLIFSSILSFGFTENILNLNDFIIIYFEGSSAELSNDWKKIDVKYKNVKKNSPLYQSLQKGIYLDRFPNINIELPLDDYITQDKAVNLLNLKQNKKIKYTKGKKIDSTWVKEIISENLKDYILSKNILQDIKNKLHDDYIYPDKIENKELKNRDIEGSVESINDDYTVYFPKNDASLFNESINGSFEGIGSYLDIIKPGIVIVTPIKGSPAEIYGLKAGDIILKVDNNKINTNTSVNQIISWVKGPSGTFVNILVDRGGEEKLLKIKRGIIILPNIEYEFLEGNNCYVSINQFNSQSRFQFKKAIDYFSTKECKKYIFDVRNNPGGILDDVGYMLNYFVPDGNTILLIKYKDSNTKVLASNQTKKLLDKKIVILINEGSASASEIFAGVIKDYVPNTLLLGTKTFGKGTVQSLIEYIDGSMLKYTIAKRYTGKSEINIDGKGFKPDMELSDNLETEMDEILEVAKMYKFK